MRVALWWQYIKLWILRDFLKENQWYSGVLHFGLLKSFLESLTWFKQTSDYHVTLELIFSAAIRGAAERSISHCCDNLYLTDIIVKYIFITYKKTLTFFATLHVRWLPHIFNRITSRVVTRLLLDEIYHHGELLFDWLMLMMEC